jgi:hypothetical protein
VRQPFFVHLRQVIAMSNRNRPNHRDTMPLNFMASLLFVAEYVEDVPRGGIFALLNNTIVVSAQPQKHTRQPIIPPDLWASP